MEKNHEELLKMLSELIQTEYAKDVSLLLVYGSSINGTSHEKSDLDVICIPKTEHGWKLSRTFLFNGVGYDVWCSSWEQLEKFARFEDMRVSILADSKLVYFGAEEDKVRYENLKKQAVETVRRGLTADLIEKAEQHIAKAKEYYADLVVYAGLLSAGGILMEIGKAVCLLNHNYLHFGIKKTAEEFLALPCLPEDFITIYQAIAEDTKAVNKNCALLIQNTEKFLKNIKKESVGKIEDFAGLYEEISSHWQKIRWACDHHDAVYAFLSSASLQAMLQEIENTLGIEVEEWHFMNAFQKDNLFAYRKEADKAEKALVDLLQKNNVAITVCDNLEQIRNLLTQ